MNKKNVIIAIVALSLSFGLGYFATPNKVVTKEVVKTVVQKEEGKTIVITKEKIVTPDGTIVEKETSREDSHSREFAKSESTSEKKVTKDVGLVISALSIVDLDNRKGPPEYAVNVSKRVFGAVSATVQVSAARRLGIGLGWSF